MDFWTISRPPLGVQALLLGKPISDMISPEGKSIISLNCFSPSSERSTEDTQREYTAQRLCDISAMQGINLDAPHLRIAPWPNKEPWTYPHM